MGHEAHHHEENNPLSFFATPLQEPSHANHHHTNASNSDTDLEQQHKSTAHAHTVDASRPNFENMDCALHDNPAFHRHAEATTAELFYDLFFVANLTTFTSMLEINDRHSLTAYIGFFSLLWLTWYQVSLYDVRFSADSVFERTAKALHFGVMVGFAVIGPQWKPGQQIYDYKIYKAFGLILMVSRLTLFAQYGITLFYTKKYRKTVLPIALVMASTLAAAILYGALTPAFPKVKLDADGYIISQASNVYIAWYIIAISETILTVAVSCYWTIISFKGTHMVQRMSLLSLIILGEGIIVICKSISKIVKNEFLWTASVVGQIIAGILIIYWLYQLYFDRIQEEHFGSIKQQIWSFLHFPLHTVLVLVLQGVSLLIIWRQAVDAMNGWEGMLVPAQDWLLSVANGTEVMPEGTTFADWVSDLTGNYTTGEIFAYFANATCYGHVYNYVPKGVDASKEVAAVYQATLDVRDGIDNFFANSNNDTAYDQFLDGWNSMTSSTLKTLFDSFSVTVAKSKNKSTGGEKTKPDISMILNQYYDIFDLVMSYTFITAGLALILITTLGFLSLPQHQRGMSTFVRSSICAVIGVALCCISAIRYSEKEMYAYLGSAWMIPTICLAMFICVVVSHVRLPKRKAH
ncbi:hypothetical protein BU25DRAFT_411189 [Macroventuria anomochaeta]|uniref:Uncharacterized protein n=1 Tax=Macroventuria anomochaeta TaxID=301207 RepID=A0ACB6RYZ7_9PLEO|nr:uncharacterized protein BU25DRAFT_411189 [Macroventuria anomochaeta]KAF2627106.1 hypothetical protein BU25DRAFT_411189 [Macroventuria anomochaeta]